MNLPKRALWLVALVAMLALIVAAACEDEGEGEPTPGQTEGQTPGAELETDHGVTDTEIKLGMTLAQSGNPSAAGYVTISTALKAYFDKVNTEDGGVCNRQINLILEDDQYDPALSLDLATKLATQDDVLAFVGNLGTPAVTGQVDYINDPNLDGDTSDGIPHLYLSTGAAKWNDPEQWPWTIGYIPDYVSEGRILGAVANERFPGQTVGILYQNDDFGEDGREGFKSVFEGEVVIEQPYEATATEITSELANIRDANPDILYLYSLPLITAQAFQYMQQNDWHPQVFWGYVNAPALVGAIVGGEEGVEVGYQRIAGTISTNYLLDPVADAENPAFVEHTRIMQEYGDIEPTALTVYGQSLGELMVHTLEIACENGDMTRAGVLAAAESIQGYTSDLYLPGIEVNISPDDHFAIQTLQPVQVQEDGSLQALGEPQSTE